MILVIQIKFLPNELKKAQKGKFRRYKILQIGQDSEYSWSAFSGARFVVQCNDAKSMFPFYWSEEHESTAKYIEKLPAN